MKTHHAIDRWVDDLVDSAHRTGFLVGAGLTGVVWILCTIWGR